MIHNITPALENRDQLDSSEICVEDDGVLMSIITEHHRVNCLSSIMEDANS